MAVLGGAALLVMALFWKEFKLLSFDPEFGATLGCPMRGLDVLLTTLLVIAIVIGLQTVGVVLMSAMIVAPAAAARQWTDRLGVMVVLAGFFGALAGVSGAVISSAGAGLSTGPVIVLCASAIVLVSLLFAPNRGLVWRWARQQRNQRTLQDTAVLSALMTARRAARHTRPRPRHQRAARDEPEPRRRAAHAGRAGRAGAGREHERRPVGLDRGRAGRGAGAHAVRRADRTGPDGLMNRMNTYQLEIQLIAAVVAVACALPGVFLVLRRMAMMSDAISHTVLLGIVLGFFLVGDLGSPLLIFGAAATGVLTVVLVEVLNRTRLVKEDAAIGLVFPALFSLAVILISRYAGNVHLDMDAVLLGELAFAPFDRLVVLGTDIGPRALYSHGRHSAAQRAVHHAVLQGTEAGHV